MIAKGTEALTVDKEFEALCRPLTPEEANLLEASITADGCREPIIVWANHEDTILDGHNRYRICTQLDVPFKTKALALPDRDACLIWIADNQLGRRNISEEDKSYLRGKKYEALKRQQGGQVGNKNAKGNDVATVATSSPRRTAEKLAKEEGVSSRTILNDAAFAKAVDAIAENAGPQARAAVMAGEIAKKEAVAIAKMPAKDQPKAIEKAIAKAPKKPAEQLTPEELGKQLDAIRDRVHRWHDTAPKSLFKMIRTTLANLAKEFE